MKFEKINKDKIKVTLNSEDLTANALDFHSFMSNSKETHSLFLNVLEQAEKDFDFSTKDYNLHVETIALADGNFIITITRVQNSQSTISEPASLRKKVKVSKKVPKSEDTSLIYRFNSFDDFCDLCRFFSKTKEINYKNLSTESSLHKYNECYYLCLSKINKDANLLKRAFSAITEFAAYVDSSETFKAKLLESGTLIYKSNAIKNCIKHFII